LARGAARPQSGNMPAGKADVGGWVLLPKGVANPFKPNSCTVVGGPRVGKR